MQKNPVYFGFVDVADEKVFTKQRMREWEINLRNAYVDVLDEMQAKMSKESPIQFFMNFSLLEETVVDAVIGMRKIVNSDNNSVEEPNAFKIAAYLTYWFLRHKPISTHFPDDFRLEFVKTQNIQSISEEDMREECRRFAWQLKHINEYVAAQFALTYIFDFNKEVCKMRDYKKIQKVDDNKLVFDDFDDMKNKMFDKFIYYLSYRAIAPKVIEHILEAYTFHPAWGLTGSHWNT
ncbi:MAG: hypothetical protein NC412_00060 [Roseburia sp.]|nr:hypothetical protein [Roseburia sp.]MCM1277632.1 hypothetical protein [Robinsoniella sp.]